MILELMRNAELFAKRKHSGMTRMCGNVSDSKHLEDVVNRLKSLGVVDEEILCAGWLHDVLASTCAVFDDLFEQFGSRIAVLVSSLTADASLPRKQRDRAYVKQLKESPFDSKLIKLCDISANLSELKNCDVSKSKKMRLVRKERKYLNVIKNDLMENDNYPKIILLMESINLFLKNLGLRIIQFQV